MLITLILTFFLAPVAITNAGRTWSGPTSGPTIVKGPKSWDCEWGDWSEYSECSASCGEGTKSASRTIMHEAENGGRECRGPSKMTVSCMIKPCVVSSGRIPDSRYQIVKGPTIVKGPKAWDCEWGDWSEYSECSTTCGYGTKTASRPILHQAENGGRDCRGPAKMTISCMIKPCVVSSGRIPKNEE